jgi:cysteine-rich repeat protein
MNRFLMLGALLSSSCTLLFLPRCGDGFTHLTEDCDDNNDISGDGCENDCTLTPPICGDGTTNGSEACDDGNNIDGDGCSAACVIELCGDGEQTPNEECDDGNQNNNDDCIDTCLNAACGDEFVQTNIEACDDGNTEGGDGCAADCAKLEVCGDNIVDVGEQCDEDNAIEGDGCDSNCTFTRCQNGIFTNELCIDAPQVLETASQPRSAATGDINGDGLLDLVVTNFLSDRVSVFFKDSRGFFVFEREISVGQGPIGVALGDLDADEDLDIVVANSASDNISFITNLGGGNLSSAIQFIVNGAPDSVLLDHFDTDGQLDIAVTGSTGVVNIILRGPNNQIIFPATQVAAQAGTREITAGDFDGDGDLDLAVANQAASSISILSNNGAGAFTATNRALQANGANANPSGITSADLDGDQDIDLLTSNASPGSFTVSVLSNDGLGGFGEQSDVLGALGPLSSAIGDINGDGRVDIVTANQGSNSINTALQQPNGSFVLGSISVVGQAPAGLVLEDLDRDDVLDVAVVLSGEDQVLVMPSLKLTPLFDTGSAPSLATMTDIEGDGDQDIVIVNTDSAARVLLGDNTGSFSLGQFLETGANTFGIIAGNFTNDDNTDVMIANFGNLKDPGGLRLYSGLGGGLLDDPAIVFSEDGFDFIVADDFDGDDIPELAVTNFANNTVIVLKQDDLNNQYEFLREIQNVGGEPFFLASGDFNNDSNVDLIASNFTPNTITLLSGDGTGNFVVGTPINVGTTPQSIAVADFNDDGLSDLAVACAGELFLFRGSSGGLQQHAVLPVDNSLGAVTFADMNGDNQIDVLASNEGANPEPGNMRIFLQKNNATFDPPVIYRTALNSQYILAGDLNNDSLPDAVTTQRDSRGINLFLSAP